MDDVSKKVLVYKGTSKQYYGKFVKYNRSGLDTSAVIQLDDNSIEFVKILDFEFCNYVPDDVAF